MIFAKRLFSIRTGAGRSRDRANTSVLAAGQSQIPNPALVKASAYASLAVHVRSRPARYLENLRRRGDGFLFHIDVVLVGPLIRQKLGTPEYRDRSGYLI